MNGWRRLLVKCPFLCPVISQIEVLGYHRLTAEDQADLEAFLAASEIIPLAPEIVCRAIALRQQNNMKLGDAIIAATALEKSLELVTRNVADFREIHGLRIWNPFPAP